MANPNPTPLDNSPIYDREHMRELYRRYKDCQQVADEMGCSVRLVRRHTYDLRKVHGVNRVTPEALATAKAVLEERGGYSEAARTSGLDWHTVRRHFPGMGLSRAESGTRSRVIQQFRALEARHETDSIRGR